MGRLVRIALLAGIAVLSLPAGALGDAAISFMCCSYSPDSVRIAPGDQVTWNGTFSDHPLVSDDAQWSTQNSGSTFSHTFATAGRFAFHCQFHGVGGGTMTGTVVVTTNHPPTASFTATPTTVTSGGSVTFDGSASSDPDGGQTLTYAWDFGDGSSAPASATPTTSHVYSNAGTSPVVFTAKLTATDSNNDPVGPESATTTRQVTVDPSPTGGGGGGGGGGGAGADTVAPTVTVKLPRLASFRGLLAGSVVARVTTSEPGSASGSLRAGTRPLGRSTVAFPVAGTRKLKLKLSRAGRVAVRRAAKRRRQWRLRFKVVVSDATGNATTVTKTISLRKK